jgi:endogenous inhibitor of DNA gyrase (YacG/DUF329 family)
MTEEEEKLNPCPVCQRPDKLRPMCYRGEPWCSDRCRKVIQGEEQPTEKEFMTMSRDLLFAVRGGGILGIWEQPEQDTDYLKRGDDLYPNVYDEMDQG